MSALFNGAALLVEFEFEFWLIFHWPTSHIVHQVGLSLLLSLVPYHLPIRDLPKTFVYQWVRTLQMGVGSGFRRLVK